jgi:signal peptidase
MKTLFKIIKGIITTFLVIVLLLVVLQKVTNNRLAIGNIYIFQVVSESMIPEYKIGDIIVSKKVPSSELHVNDDVTYLGRETNLKDLIVTHRIIKEREENGIKYFVTKGIANQIEDPEISEKDIYGKVIYHTILFSFVGRLMTNIVIYYLMFVIVGVSFAYEFISSFIIKHDDEEEEQDEK